MREREQAFKDAMARKEQAEEAQRVSAEAKRRLAEMPQ
jgi:hypothetical protein